MTGEELEKEAEEYALDTYEMCSYSDLPYASDRRAREQAYIAAAEPREKRIEELEVKIKKLTQHLEPQLMTELLEQVREEVEQEQKLKELEKENAELKKVKQVKIEVTRDYKKLAKDLQEQGNQLTKAKEIIKELLDTQSHLDPYRDIFKDRILKAEQFLKETE